MLVEVRNAIFGYGKRAVVRVNLLDIHAGRCLGIFGPNGVGKTTLVRGMTGLLKPMSGSVARGEGEPVRFGYLPQHRAMELHWPMTGFDAAAMAISALRPLGRVRGRDAEQVREAMRHMNVLDLARRPFGKLSGGQQQRMLLAGALAVQPSVLVLDEVTEGLDVRSRQALLDVLHDQNVRGLSTVMISHEVQDLMYLADQIAWLHPPDDPGQPSHVEVISPDELRQRVLQVKRAS